MRNIPDERRSQNKSVTYRITLTSTQICTMYEFCTALHYASTRLCVPKLYLRKPHCGQSWQLLGLQKFLSLTNSIQQICSLDKNSRLVYCKFPVLCVMAYTRVSILSWASLYHSTSHLLKVHFSVIVPSTISPFPHACCRSRTTYPTPLGQPNLKKSWNFVSWKTCIKLKSYQSQFCGNLNTTC